MKKKFFSLFLMVAMLSTSLSMNVIWAEEFSDMEFEDGEDFEEGQKSESEEISTGTQNETQVDEQEEAAVLLEESNKSADEYLEEDFTADDETDLFFDENEENSTDELVVSDGIQSIASGQCGENAYWNFYSNGELEISGTGPMYDYCAPLYHLGEFTKGEKTPWRSDFNGLIKKITVKEGITRIGIGAFVGAGADIEEYSDLTLGKGYLTSVKLPASLQTIGAYAFADVGCDDLIIPEGITTVENRAFLLARFQSVTINTEKIYKNMFYNSKISSVIMSDNVKVIEEKAFEQCYELESVKFSNSLWSLGRFAFIECTSLKSVKLPVSVTEMNGESFYGCESLESAIIEANVSTLGGSCFFGCKNLKTVYLPDTLTDISTAAFDGCSNLSEITIPSGVKIIWPYAFWKCSSLKNITIPDRVEKIYGSAFGKCDSLTNVTIPASVKEITYGLGDTKLGTIYNSFVGCKNLVSLNVVPENATYASYEGCLYSKDMKTLRFCPMGLKKIIVPDTVSEILSSAFYNADSTDTSWEDIYFKGSAPDTSEYMPELPSVTAYVPADDTTWTTEKKAGYGSAITWKTWQPSLNKCDISLTTDSYVYDGKAKEPSVEVTGGSLKLTKDVDYTVSYINNVNAGTATVNVTGIGMYSGTASKNFVINKKKETLQITVPKNTMQIGENIQLNVGNKKGNLSYQSSDKGIITVDSDGKVTAKKAGSATLTVTDSGNTNFEKAEAKVTVSVQKKCFDNKHVWDNGKVVKEATCEAEGTKSYTCLNCQEVKTETIARTEHTWGKWEIVSDATVFSSKVQRQTCQVCGVFQEKNVGSKLKSTMKLSVSSLKLKVKQTTSALQISQMSESDYVKSVKSNNNKVLKVIGFTADRSVTLKAQNKTGKAKVTITLAGGAKKTVTVTVQKGTVKTTKISGLAKAITLKKGKKQTLKPVLTPITSQEKITYTTSNKKVATVTKNGVITAKKKGTAKITVKSGKKKAVVTVKVK